MASACPSMAAASVARPEMVVVSPAVCHLAGEASSPQNSFLKGVPEAHLREVRSRWSHSGWVAEPGREPRAFSAAMPALSSGHVPTHQESRWNRLSCGSAWEFAMSTCFNAKIVVLSDPE